MKVAVIPIVIGALWTIPKGFVKGLEDLEIRGQVQTIQTTALLRSPKTLRVLEESYFLSNSSEKSSTNAGVKNFQKSKKW